MKWFIAWFIDFEILVKIMLTVSVMIVLLTQVTKHLLLLLNKSTLFYHHPFFVVVVFRRMWDNHLNTLIVVPW